MHRARTPRRRRRCASCPSTTTSCSHTTIAAASSGPTIAPCSRPSGSAATALSWPTGSSAASGAWRPTALPSAMFPACRSGRWPRSRPRAGGSHSSSRRRRAYGSCRSVSEAGAAARERERAPLGRERERLLHVHPLGQGVREPRREAVARAVGVLVGSGRSGGLVRPAGLRPAAERAGGGDDELRRRIEVAGLVALGVVLPARDERVELDARGVQRRRLACGRDEEARAARLADRLGVACGEVDAVRVVELLPGQRALAALGARLLSDHGDRPLADLVHVAEAAPLEAVRVRRVDPDAGGLEADPRLSAEIVTAEEAVEHRLPREPRQLDRRDAPTAGRFLPGLERGRDLARARNRLDPGEVDPLDVPDDSDVHDATLTDAGAPALKGMMEAVATVPPFEHFYVEHRDVVLGFLRKRLGGQAAEDAFQETFLRALRAYDRLEHGEHLRAWVLTIASRLVIDSGRRARPTAHELPELPVEDGRPAYAQIEHLADGLPPTERAALVLRYAYDLSYDDIADALGSTPEAARQAASSGVRRLRAGRIHEHRLA